MLVPAVCGRCSRPACSPSWWASPPAASRRPRPSRSPSARRTSRAPRPSSQAYGQALQNKGYDITFKDNLGADRDRLQGAQERRPRRLRRLPGHAPHLPGRQPTVELGRDVQGPPGEARRHRHRGEQAGARGRRERLLRHQGHRQEVQAQKLSDLTKVAPQAHLRDDRPSARSGRSASATRRSSSTA